jgi:sterol 14-demethylase
VAGSALMGDDFQKNIGKEFWQLYTAIGQALDMTTPVDWPLPKNIRRDRAKAKMREMLKPLIAERRAHPDQYDDFLQDFINTRTASGQLADDLVIIDLLRAFMFASHETTAGQAAWTIIEILRHPDYRARVEAEIAENVANGAALDGTIMRSLQHIAWAVREVERLHPSADMLMRVAETDIDVGDYTIPNGWLIMVSAAVAHRLPELFKDPLWPGPQRRCRTPLCHDRFWWRWAQVRRDEFRQQRDAGDHGAALSTFQPGTARPQPRPEFWHGSRPSHADEGEI